MDVPVPAQGAIPAPPQGVALQKPVPAEDVPAVEPDVALVEGPIPAQGAIPAPPPCIALKKPLPVEDVPAAGPCGGSCFSSRSHPSSSSM